MTDCFERMLMNLPVIPMDSLRRRRSARARAELRALRDTVKAWRKKRHELDVDVKRRPAGHHKSQIRTIANAVEAIAAELFERSEEWERLDSEEFFAKCVLIEQAGAWLGRFFDIFAVKFAQRENGFGDVLRAADEVLWSCYEPVMRAAGLRETMPAPPLPFVARELSPAAIVHDTPLRGSLASPVELAPELEAFVKSIPMPLLQIPPHCAHSPWNLVLVAHESGHFLIQDLEIEAYLAEGIAAAGANEIAPEASWRVWAGEIGADFISLLLMGGAARDALRDELPGSSGSEGDGAHPPAAIRLAVLDTAAQALKVGVEESAADRRYEALVTFLRSPLPQGQTLETLCDFNARGLAQIVSWWEERMQDQQEVEESGFESPRRAAAAAYRAWANLSAQPNGDISEAMQRLSARALALVAGCGPEGERAAVEPAVLDTPQRMASLLIGGVTAMRRNEGREEHAV
jgi:hypothetical protein